MISTNQIPRLTSSKPGRITTRAPIAPSPSANHLLGPICSFRTRTAATLTHNGDISISADASAKVKSVNAKNQVKIAMPLTHPRQK